MMLLVSVFFFFFQAEDGIRDLTVTGVQTCALPISATHLQIILLYLQRQTRDLVDPALKPSWPVAREDLRQDTLWQGSLWVVYSSARSEERRVGKECRSRWSSYH